MRLTLTYDGPLHAATGSNPRSQEKNDIRRRFHPQLREAWLHHPALADGQYIKDWEETAPGDKYSDMPNSFLRGYKVGDYGFIPLVCSRHHMICELDVLFLRREKPGELFHAGDLDNRLKTLFDSLKMPADNELAGLGDNEPEPFFCLLQDDALITAVNLKTTQWFEPPTSEAAASNIRLIIDILVRITRVTYANIGLGS